MVKRKTSRAFSLRYKIVEKIYKSKGKMTQEEKEAQRRSFAFGNTFLENPDITRELIEKEAENLHSQATDNEKK